MSIATRPELAIDASHNDSPACGVICLARDMPALEATWNPFLTGVGHDSTSAVGNAFPGIQSLALFGLVGKQAHLVSTQILAEGLSG